MLAFEWKDKSGIYQLIVAIVAVTLIILGCLIILSPFFAAILTSIILALSAWPAFAWLKHRLGDRTVLASAIMTTLLGLCFVAPLIIIGTSITDNFTQVYTTLESAVAGDTATAGKMLGSVPYAGQHLEKYWLMLTADKEKVMRVLQEYGGDASELFISLGGTIGRGLFDLTLGVLLTYFLFRHGAHAAVRVRNLIDTFGGEQGQRLLQISKNTLIGVVYGILGTALAQGALASFGFWISGVPGATFLGLLTFFLAFIPMGPPLIWIPASIWLFNGGAVQAAIFLFIWGLLVISAIDNFLKPYFISLGSNLPFMLVLLGIAGGVISFGFIGIFIGPTLLALAYALIIEWSGARKAMEASS